MVMVKYKSKSKAGTYRLRIIVEVEVDGYNLVRTLLVVYRLIRELPLDQRLLCKGLTMKILRVSVQQVVLLLPVEERVSNLTLILVEAVMILQWSCSISQNLMILVSITIWRESS